MGVDLWNHMKFLHHKVRNMARRGWLIKTYNDKKILRARVGTGHEIENDYLDIIHPVGYVAHVKPDDKAEIITLDIGADTSRRVVLAVMGDRIYHPQPDEGEAYTYAPGNKKIYSRIKMKSDGGGSASNSGDSRDGQTIDRGHEAGIHSDGEDQRITDKTQSSYGMQADKGVGHQTGGNFTVKASANTQFESAKHMRKAEETHIESPSGMFVQAPIHAMDHIAGGGTSVQVASAAVVELAANADESPRPQEDGTKTWQAQPKPGTVSLLQTAASLANFQQQQGQTNQQVQQQIDALTQQTGAADASLQAQITALADRTTALEGRVTDLEGRVSTLESGLGSAGSDITTMQDQIADLDTRVTALEAA